MVVCVLLAHGLYAQQAMRKKDTSMTIAQQERRRAEVVMDSTKVIVCQKCDGKGSVKRYVFLLSLPMINVTCGWLYVEKHAISSACGLRKMFNEL